MFVSTKLIKTSCPPMENNLPFQLVKHIRALQHIFIPHWWDTDNVSEILSIFFGNWPCMQPNNSVYWAAVSLTYSLIQNRTIHFYIKKLRHDICSKGESKTFKFLVFLKSYSIKRIVLLTYCGMKSPPSTTLPLQFDHPTWHVWSEYPKCCLYVEWHWRKWITLT